jgi:hypothetical protein
MLAIFMTDMFTMAEIDELSAEIDRQLLALHQPGMAAYRSGDELERVDPPRRYAPPLRGRDFGG